MFESSLGSNDGCGERDGEEGEMIITRQGGSGNAPCTAVTTTCPRSLWGGARGKKQGSWGEKKRGGTRSPYGGEKLISQKRYETVQHVV